MVSVPQPHPRFVALDGLRGIAVLLVVIGHGYSQTLEADAGMPVWFSAVVDNSSFGVRLFFLLSGFLITWLILREKEKTGRFSFRGFYTRRARRILPAYWFLILCLGLGTIGGVFTIQGEQFAHALGFVWNYSFLWFKAGAPEGTWLLGHLWTLAVEVQFYLIWPVVLLLFNEKRAGWVCLLVALGMPFVRLGSYFLFPDQRGLLGMMFHTSLDPLMLGAAVAIWRKYVPASRLPYLFHPLVLMAAVGFCFLLSPVVAAYIPGYRVTFGFLLEAIAGALCLWAAIDANWGIRILCNRALCFCGLISYSWYLWQQVFYSPYENLIPLSFLLGFALSFVVAAVSYQLVERPFLRTRPA